MDKKKEEEKQGQSKTQFDVSRYFVPTQMVQVYNSKQFNLPVFPLDGFEHQPPMICKCVFIDEISQIDLLDELIYLDENEIIGINVQMNADVLNDMYQIDVFGPSLFSLGTINKIFIVDILKLGKYSELDIKLQQVFTCTRAIFAGFGVPTLINYFKQFYRDY